MKELKKIGPNDFDDKETDHLLALIEKMDHEQDFDPKNKNYDEMELEDSSIDSNETIDSNNKTKIGILQVSKD